MKQVFVSGERVPHALIIGGGIAGPVLALFLKKIGITSTIYEAYPHRSDIGGGFQISPNGMHVLDKIGLAQKVAQAGHYSPNWRFLDQTGKVLVRFKNGRIERYGQPAVAIARSTFHQILVEEVARQGISLEYGKRLKAITDREGAKTPAAGVIAQFEDGSQAEGNFLVGADGVWSATRQLILPAGPQPRYTTFTNLGGFVDQAAVPAMTEEDRNCMNMVFGEAGAFGFCKANADSVMWWCNPVREREMSRAELAAISMETIRAELLASYKGWPEPVVSLVKAASETVHSNIYEIPSLPKWYAGRVVLIGDAAHAMNPTAGQGASTSLEDAMYLAKLLGSYRYRHQAFPATTGQFEEVFSELEQGRRPRVEKIIARAQRLSQDKKPARPLVNWLRTKAMAVFFTLFGERLMDEAYGYRIEWKAAELEPATVSTPLAVPPSR